MVVLLLLFLTCVWTIKTQDDVSCLMPLSTGCITELRVVPGTADSRHCPLLIGCFSLVQWQICGKGVPGIDSPPCSVSINTIPLRN